MLIEKLVNGEMVPIEGGINNKDIYTIHKTDFKGLVWLIANVETKKEVKDEDSEL